MDGNKTRSGLTAAQIIEVKDDGSNKSGGIVVNCTFNPYEYTVSKRNKYKSKPKNGVAVAVSNFEGPGPQTLKLKLIFDTFESGSDVTKETRKLWKLMDPKTRENSNEKKRSYPPAVAFEWGIFRFVSVIESVTQKFTLFLPDGTPVRADVSVTFVQHNDLEDYQAKKQNPTSGDGPVERVWTVQAGDRIDLIAAEVYGDATQWPHIAAYNGIYDPHKLPNGEILSIPEI